MPSEVRGQGVEGRELDEEWDQVRRDEHGSCDRASSLCYRKPDSGPNQRKYLMIIMSSNKTLKSLIYLGIRAQGTSGRARHRRRRFMNFSRPCPGHPVVQARSLLRIRSIILYDTLRHQGEDRSRRSAGENGQTVETNSKALKSDPLWKAPVRLHGV